MRKKPFVLCAAIAAAVVLPSLAAAQESAWQWGFGGGPVWPQSDFKQEAKGPAYHVMGSAAYQPSRLPFQIQTEVYFQDFRNVTREPGLYVSIGGELFREFSFLVNAKYAIPSPVVRPYVKVGTGYTYQWYDDRAYWQRHNYTIGLNAGAGVEVPVIAGAAVFIEGRYMNVVVMDPLPLRPPATQSEVDFKTVPLTIGVRF